MTRLERLVLLLETRDDYLQPYSDPAISRYPGIGAGPERKETCSKCKGAKQMLGSGPCQHCWQKTGIRHNCSQCDKCKGKGSYWVNSFVGQVEGAPERKAPLGGPRRARKAMSHRDMGDVIHRVTAQRELQWARGSYEDVEKALRRLQYEDEVACYLVKAVHIGKRWSVAPSTATGLALARGLLTMLDYLVGSKLKVPARLLVKDSGSRSTAKAHGLSRNQVRRVA